MASGAVQLVLITNQRSVKNDLNFVSTKSEDSQDFVVSEQSRIHRLTINSAIKAERQMRLVQSEARSINSSGETTKVEKLGQFVYSGLEIADYLSVSDTTAIQVVIERDLDQKVIYAQRSSVTVKSTGAVEVPIVSKDTGMERKLEATEEISSLALPLIETDDG